MKSVSGTSFDGSLFLKPGKEIDFHNIEVKAV